MAKANARKRKAEAEQSQSAGREVVPLNQEFAPEGWAGIPLTTSSSPDGSYALQVPDLDGDGAPTPQAVLEYTNRVHGARKDAEQQERLRGVGDKSRDLYLRSRFGPFAQFLGRDDVQPDGARDVEAERIGSAVVTALDFPTRGFDDEIAGTILGPDAKAAIRANKEAAYEQHPVSALAIQGPLSLVADPLAKVKGATVAQRALSGAARGGAAGALYGVGSGDQGDRLEKGLAFGATGAAFGGVGTLAFDGVSTLARTLPTAEMRAFASKLFNGGNYALNAKEIRALDSALENMQLTARVNGQNLTRQQAQQQLVAGLRQAEANDFVFEALGDQAIDAATGVAQRGMAGAPTAREALTTRAEGQFDRLNETLNRLAGGEDVATTLSSLQNLKSEQAGPLYAQAFRQPVDYVRPEFDQLKRIMSLEDFQAGRAQGERILRNRTRNPEAKFEQLPFFEQVQYIKEGVDDKIGAALKAGDTKLAGSLIDAKNEMLRLTDDLNPAYAQARGIWAGAQAQENAALLGERVFGSGQDSQLRNLKAAVEGMSEAEKTAFSVGMYDKAREIMGSAVNNAESNAVRSRLINQNAENKIRALLPPEQADEFVSTLNREFRQQRTTQQVLPSVGSPTASRTESAEAVRQNTAGPIRRAFGAVLGGKQTIDNVTRRARERIESDPGVQNALTQFLYTRADDPGLRNALRVDPPVSTPAPAAPVANALSENGTSGRAGRTAADVTAVSAVAANAPKANAETTSGEQGQLNAANERVLQMESRVTQLENYLTQLTDPNLDAREKQQALSAFTGRELAIDGIIGPQTQAAIREATGQLRTDIEGAREELQLARDRRTEIEQRAVFEDASEGNSLMQKALPIAGALGGLYLGTRLRGGAVNKSRQAANALEDQVNSLVNAAPVSRAATGQNALSTRAANMNEFWRQGGAGESVPFRTMQSGEIRPRPRPAEPSQLYPQPNRFTSTDVGIMAGGVAEGAAMEIPLQNMRAELEKTKADIERYAAEGDTAGLERALNEKAAIENWIMGLETAQRVGVGVAGGRALGALKMPYARPQPNVAGAEAERALLLQRINRNRQSQP